MDVSKRVLLSLIVCTYIFPLSIYAADNTADIDVKRDLAQLKKQMQNLEMRLASTDQATKNVETVTSSDTIAISDTSKNKKNIHKVQRVRKKAQPAAAYKGNEVSPSSANPVPHFSWHGPDISALIVGGASAGFSKPSGKSGSFDILDFNPIFLFSYKDLFFLRSAVDFSLDDQGNTQTNLNYLNLNLFLNDYIVFGAGKFDSALGYFGQNLSPAWINRLPEAPVGFNGDQAAPQAEVGIRLQGAIPIATTMRLNYAFFVSDGDQAFVDTTNLVVDHIGSNGYTNNFGNYLYGARLGFLPIPKLEIGISAATGKLVLFDLADGVTQLQRSRVYDALGADISYKPGNWDLRWEIIQQQIASQDGSIVPQAQKWKAWYAQVAYWIPNTKWEPVVRYGYFTAPVASQRQRQWAFGLDYWFAPSIAAQAAFERNRGQSGTDSNDNRFLIQLVFGY